MCLYSTWCLLREYIGEWMTLSNHYQSNIVAIQCCSRDEEISSKKGLTQSQLIKYWSLSSRSEEVVSLEVSWQLVKPETSGLCCLPLFSAIQGPWSCPSGFCRWLATEAKKRCSIWVGAAVWGAGCRKAELPEGRGTVTSETQARGFHMTSSCDFILCNTERNCWHFQCKH